MYLSKNCIVKNVKILVVEEVPYGCLMGNDLKFLPQIAKKASLEVISSSSSWTVDFIYFIDFMHYLVHLN